MNSLPVITGLLGGIFTTVLLINYRMIQICDTLKKLEENNEQK